MLTATDPTIPKADILQEVKSTLDEQGFSYEDINTDKPWGAYYRFAESDLPQFLKLYFPDFDPSQLEDHLHHSPKILIVAPDARLSWQYHHRRAELWRCEDGPAGVIISNTDQPTPQKTLKTGDTIHVPQGQRHRLVGLRNWATIAEIWQHTDPDHPSNEADIIRLEDDYNRQ